MANLAGKVEDQIGRANFRLELRSLADIERDKADLVADSGNILEIRSAAFDRRIHDRNGRAEFDQTGREIAAYKTESPGYESALTLELPITRFNNHR
jgi:hypothetical protein